MGMWENICPNLVLFVCQLLPKTRMSAQPQMCWFISHFDTFVFIHAFILQWILKRTQITNPKNIIHYPDSHHSHGLISTSIGLNMRIQPQYFEHNTMTIKCIASISPVIWSGKKETIIQQGLQQFDIPPPSIDTREAMFLGIAFTKYLSL